MRIFLDGEQIFTGRLEAGKAVQYTAKDGILLETGNAAGFTAILNNQEIQGFGPIGTLARVSFTASGMTNLTNQPFQTQPAEATKGTPISPTGSPINPNSKPMKKIPENTFHIISLGCAKNLVDSQSYAQLMGKRHLFATEKISKAKFILVNTCGFIHDAREESFETIRTAAKQKKPGQKLIVTGCLSERYKEALLDEVDGIDGLVGTRNLHDLTTLLSALEKKTKETQVYFPEYQRIVNQADVNSVAIQGSSAYLKIADGCRRACAFCAIPFIKGPLVSRPREQVLADALLLQDQGVQEINLIAQDPTDYGLDLYGKPSFYQAARRIATRNCSSSLGSHPLCLPRL